LRLMIPARRNPVCVDKLFGLRLVGDTQTLGCRNFRLVQKLESTHLIKLSGSPARKELVLETV
jgi:hypothetical protein